ncbi:MAG TPA: carboxypeptidase-like regulatory domain-containing protein [bacterium]|nr:carboxypeptidase-like regulatory domain-containing protein [bacterium]HPN42592.1 carboxypeptidase-like regulatory domain-containing protein [bacterium]
MKSPAMLQKVFFFLTFLIPFSFSPLFSQNDEYSTLKGYVYDAETGEALAYVNVFFSNTTLGDATDENGYYEINKIPAGAYDLIVNRIGYEINTQILQFLEETVISKDIKLNPKPLMGEEIQVEANEYKNWFSNMEIFKKAFIGETVNSKNCKILNPQVISFSIDPATRDLCASSDSIIHIENLNLGYHIDLILEEFRYNEDYVRYGVYPRFREMNSEDNEQLQQWRQNRMNSWQGSMKHFLSAFAKGKVDKEKFELEKGTGKISENLQQKQVITRGMKSLLKPTVIGLNAAQKKLGLKVIKFNDYLKITYKGKKQKDGMEMYDEYFPTSFLLLNSNQAIIDSFGNVHTANAFQVFGNWSEYRIADTLPLDYIPQ